MLSRLLHRFYSKPKRGQAYQEKLAESLTERCQQLQKAIPPGCGSVLDVGCNLGDITAWCARQGYWSVGIDSSRMLIGEAQVRNAVAGTCAFMHQRIGPADIERLPQFDVVLMLSVHHHWLMEHGPDVAGRMLRDIFSRTKRVLVFESASRNVRYGDYPPNFIDNDEESVTGYLRSYLDHHLGDLCSRIEPLGKTRCVGEREPFRWAWALVK